ncbi:MAG: murein biosynthesis integral membrane protein MurJ [Chitinivibrionales bacterium]|nr:murein biosynthesis integral membrane protein MurJ [Chitinivibrionales bacterium]MBD3358012.1 murein biosynthesis integral membrane protein MurJ [Chitinivibrionales bacterium]
MSVSSPAAKPPSEPGLARSISIAALIMAASNILSRLLGLARELILAHLVGTHWTYDAYVFAFTLPELINHFAAASALSIPFIPIFQKHLADGETERAWRFFANLLLIGTMLLTALLIPAIRYTEQALALAGDNIDDPSRPELLALTVRLTHIVLPAQFFFFWGALFNGVQYAHKKFVLPALMPVLYNTGIISCGLLLFPQLGIEGFAWGVLAGAFVGNVVLQLPGALRVGMRFRPAKILRDPDLKVYLLGVLPLVLGYSMVNANEVLFRVFGTFVPEGEGALGSLNYALRTMLMLVGVFGQALATGAYPFISQLAVQHNFDELARLTNKMISRIAAFVIPVSAIMMALSKEIVAVLYRHGEFGLESTRMTARALTYYLVGAFFQCGALVSNRLYYAARNTVFPMLVSTGVVVAAIPLYLWLGRTMGVGGVALAGSIGLAAQFIIIYGTWSVQHHNVAVIRVLVKIVVITATSTASAVLTLWIKQVSAGLLGTVESPQLRGLATVVAAGFPPLLLTLAVLDFTGTEPIWSTLTALLRGRRTTAVLPSDKQDKKNKRH